MKNTNLTLAVATIGLALATTSAWADDFGSGPNTFTIDFVDVGNAGNGDVSDDDYGGVGYNYRISTYEISRDNVRTATDAGLAHVTTGVVGTNGQNYGVSQTFLTKWSKGPRATLNPKSLRKWQ